MRTLARESGDGSSHLLAKRSQRSEQTLPALGAPLVATLEILYLSVSEATRSVRA